MGKVVEQETLVAPTAGKLALIWTDRLRSRSLNDPNSAPRFLLLLPS